MNLWLLDTGPIVAFLNPGDPSNGLVEAAFAKFRGSFVTTNAIIGEAMYFASGLPGGPELLSDFLRVTATRVIDSCQPDQLDQAVMLMRKYADIPMDFADATLILLGATLRINHICTLDRRGFSTFRTATGKRFNLVLDDFAS